MKLMWPALFLAFTILIMNCQPSESGVAKNSFQLMALIEIPAGTNKKIEFDKQLGEFKVDTKNGKERVIDFLPYPANYGFIPGTLMAESAGGDGDALDVLIIAESIATGTTLEFIPITMLKLVDEGELDYKILGVPKDPILNVTGVSSFAELKADHPAILDIIETWFLNYDVDETRSKGWASEAETQAEISKWIVEE